MNEREKGRERGLPEPREKRVFAGVGVDI